MKFLEAQDFPRNRIIDGRVFKVPNLNFTRLLAEGVAYGVIEDKNSFDANSYVIYPQVYNFRYDNSVLTFGKKSYINPNAAIKGNGVVSIGKISSFAEDIIFALGQNYSHNYRNVGTIPIAATDWKFPSELLPPQGVCKILIGNDVWIGRGSTLKASRHRGVAQNQVVGLEPRQNPRQLPTFQRRGEIYRSARQELTS